MKRFRLILFLALALILAACTTQSLSPTPFPGTPLPPSTATAPPEPTAVDTQEPTPTEEPTQAPTATEAQPETQNWVAYIDLDGNLALVARATGETRQITQDAARLQPSSDVQQDAISYCCAQWSSDGALLAYQRDVGVAIESGYDFELTLWVYDLEAGSSRPVLTDGQTNGFGWRPGERLIAYGKMIPTEFFFERSAEYAVGIWAVVVDTGETYELVAPENGLPLGGPQWSPDGRFLGFDEISQMEGRGTFAYFDFETQTYNRWEDTIGAYDWSPGGELVAYDRQAYTATGGERIWARERQGEKEGALSPDYGAGYAYGPVFSPDGNKLAYLAALGGPETFETTLYVVDVEDGEPRELGTFEQILSLGWSADGENLVFSAGPFETQQVLEVSAQDGASRVLAEGRFPAVQPVE
jgi:Tol biopolymer transport system component